jgi:hypothetical protein
VLPPTFASGSSIPLRICLRTVSRVHQHAGSSANEPFTLSDTGERLHWIYPNLFYLIVLSSSSASVVQCAYVLAARLVIANSLCSSRCRSLISQAFSTGSARLLSLKPIAFLLGISVLAIKGLQLIPPKPNSDYGKGEISIVENFACHALYIQKGRLARLS